MAFAFSCFFYEGHNPYLVNKRVLVNVLRKSGGTDGQKINEMARPRQFIFNKRRACFYLQSRKKGQDSPKMKRDQQFQSGPKNLRNILRGRGGTMLKNVERGSKNRVIGKIYCSEIVFMTYCVLFSAMHNFLDHFFL